MKTIALNVTCTYDVEITREVSDEVYDQLCEIYDNGGSISDSEITNGKAMDFLSANVEERDALNWEYRIDDFIEED